MSISKRFSSYYSSSSSSLAWSSAFRPFPRSAGASHCEISFLHPNRREESACFVCKRERERERIQPRDKKQRRAKRVRKNDHAMTTTITIISRTAFASSVRSDRSKTVVPLLQQVWWSSRFCDDAPRVSSPRTLSRLPRRSPGRRRAGRRRARWTRSARRAMDAYSSFYSVALCVCTMNEETNNGIRKSRQIIRKKTKNVSFDTLNILIP